MFKILIFTTILIALTNALEPAKIELGGNKVREIVNKYIKNVPDIENQYIINEDLSKVISQLFKGKLSMLPLYKINLKIDRNPIKIPWTIQDENMKNGKITDRKINTMK